MENGYRLCIIASTRHENKDECVNENRNRNRNTSEWIVECEYLWMSVCLNVNVDVNQARGRKRKDPSYLNMKRGADLFCICVGGVWSMEHGLKC